MAHSLEQYMGREGDSLNKSPVKELKWSVPLINAILVLFVLVEGFLRELCPFVTERRKIS